MPGDGPGDELWAVSDDALMPTVAMPSHDGRRPLALRREGDKAMTGDGPRDELWTVSDEVKHDVVNALTAALGYVQLLRHRRPTHPHAPQQDLKTLSAIEANMVHAIHLLRGEPWHRHAAPCDLVVLAHEAAAQVPPDRAADVAVQWSGKSAPVGFWDPLAVSRILANLLDNAAKYLLPGTPIVVALATEDAGVEVVVRDRGIGIPEMELEAIFAGHRTAEARAMAPGQGLGLRSSRQLAEELGGLLWVTREPEEGTAVHLWLSEVRPAELESAPEILEPHPDT